MHMQSYYIQYPTVHPNHASPQRPVGDNNNLIKKDIDYSKADEKDTK